METAVQSPESSATLGDPCCLLREAGSLPPPPSSLTLAARNQHLALFPFQHSIFNYGGFWSSSPPRIHFLGGFLIYLFISATSVMPDIEEINNCYPVINEPRMNSMGLKFKWQQLLSVDLLCESYILPVDTLSSCHSEATEPHLLRVAPSQLHVVLFFPLDAALISNPQGKPCRCPDSSGPTFTKPCSPTHYGWHHSLPIVCLSLLHRSS